MQGRLDERVRVVQNEIENSLAPVESLWALQTAAGPVDRHQFRAFTQPFVLNHYSVETQSFVSAPRLAIQALGWNPRVSDAERQQHEESARRDGIAQYVISERDADGHLVPAAHRSEYFPASFIEPYQGNAPALGFDVASDPGRLRASSVPPASVAPSIPCWRAA